MQLNTLMQWIKRDYCTEDRAAGMCIWRHIFSLCTVLCTHLPSLQQHTHFCSSTKRTVKSSNQETICHIRLFSKGSRVLKRTECISWTRIVQSVKRLATGWTVRGDRIPVGGEILSTCQDHRFGDQPDSCTVDTGSHSQG